MLMTNCIESEETVGVFRPSEVKAIMYWNQRSPLPSCIPAGMALAPQVTMPVAFEQPELALVRSVQAPVNDAESGAERIDTVAVVPAGIDALSTQIKRLMILDASAESNFDEVSEPLAGK